MYIYIYVYIDTYMINIDTHTQTHIYIYTPIYYAYISSIHIDSLQNYIPIVSPGSSAWISVASGGPGEFFCMANRLEPQKKMGMFVKSNGQHSVCVCLSMVHQFVNDCDETHSWSPDKESSLGIATHCKKRWCLRMLCWFISPSSHRTFDHFTTNIKLA